MIPQPQDQRGPARKGKRILALDGGGIRGLVELVILDAIEKKTGRKIHELFDLVGGTSTGGIIALVLGLNLQGVGGKQDENKSLIDRALTLYEELATQVFGGSWWDIVTKPYSVYREYIARGGALYSTNKLAELMKNNLKPQPNQDFEFPLGQFEEKMPDHPKCKTFVVATCSYCTEFMPFLFRSYYNPCHVDLWGLARQPTFHGLLGAQFGVSPLIWEAARGTSAAPTYFEPLVLHPADTPGQKVAFVDGGMVANNPAMLAVFECHSLWPDDPIDCVVSLGTGSNLEKEVKAMRETNGGIFKAVSKIALESGLVWGSNAVEIATCSESIHWQVRNWLAMGRDTAYFRFNPQNLNENIDLAECRPAKIKELMDKAREFISDEIIQQELDVLCKILLCEPGWQEVLQHYRRHGVPKLEGKLNAARIG
jgi:calcium-independent phospholipase A2-gamma